MRSITGLLLLLPVGTTPEPFTLELAAGKHARKMTPVRAELPQELSGAWRLVREDGREVPVQVYSKFATWILEEELPAGKTRRYKLEAKEPAAAPRVECKDDGKGLEISVGGKKVFRYNTAVIEQPNPVFSRSGYLHPVWTPSGKLLTNDGPKNHLHHHGIWAAWSSNGEYKGHALNFWESASKTGTIEFAGVEAKWEGPVAAGFRARHKFADITAKPPEHVIDETWLVSVYAIDAYFLFDLSLNQACVGDAPFILKKHRYGGIGFRGSIQWEGKDGVEFLSSEGHNRAAAPEGQAAKWAYMFGKIDGEPASVGFMSHPTNPRSPQNMRMHPSEPFFNYTPCQTGDMEIAPGKPYAARYRYVVPKGHIDKAEMERLWLDYAEPPQVTVGR